MKSCKWSIVVIFLIALVVGNVFVQPFAGGKSGGGWYAAIQNSIPKDVEDEEIFVPYSYEPSIIEDYLVQHTLELGYTGKSLDQLAPGCKIWKNPPSEIAHALKRFEEALKEYNLSLSLHPGAPVRDLRQKIREDGGRHDICHALAIDPNRNLVELFQGITHDSDVNMNDLDFILTKTQGGGWVEPLVPPMRDPRFCFDRTKLMSLRYIVHDFVYMCRKLQPDSRIVLFDLGAALDFAHHDVTSTDPSTYLLYLYDKFGFRFDHIYAFEAQNKDPKAVYKQIPDRFRGAYHWYNVGVASTPASPHNPWNLLKENFRPDDLVIVKLDIDMNTIELSLAEQLLKDDELIALVDCFYFEHHVFLKELYPDWANSMKGSVADSLELFSKLRARGVAAHFWV